MNIESPTSKFMALPFLRGRSQSTHENRQRRLMGFEWLPRTARNHLVAWIGEFAGTFMFLFFAFSATQVANAAAAGSDTGGAAQAKTPQPPNTSILLYISLAFGFSLAVNVWVFFRISGGLFNPAVTLGLCLIGGAPWIRGAVIVTAQLLGAIASAGVVSALFPGELAVRTTLSGGTSIVRGLFIEMFLTAQLVFTIFMLAAEKHKGTYLAPVGIGLSLFIAELSGVYFTGGSLNPARSFGPAVVAHRFSGYHWIYWVGPGLGALLAVVFYRLIKVLEYETANPGQDFDDKEIEVFRPDENANASQVRRPHVVSGDPEYVAGSSGILTSPSRSATGESGLVPGGQRLSGAARGRSSVDAPATSAQPAAATQNLDEAAYRDAPTAEGGAMPATKKSYVA